jgi:hypothetical protein
MISSGAISATTMPNDNYMNILYFLGFGDAGASKLDAGDKILCNAKNSAGRSLFAA